MQIHLSLRRSGTALIYGIPLWYRIASSVIALTLAVSSSISGAPSLGALVVVAVAAAAALYQERWSFDAASGECSGRVGFVFAARGPSFKADEVARVRLDTFAKGRLDQNDLPPDDKLPHGSQTRLIVDLKDGESYMIDSVPVKRRSGLELSARAIAEALGTRLE
ncbi:MAG: hypothetical protein H7A27_03455 [Spirochaetaceae bacterium]|nr:hypothetical protein [Spirochaetaceae bacterium]HPE90581.1 hypothetical protein [Spirochaetales bacterium]